MVTGAGRGAGAEKAPEPQFLWVTFTKSGEASRAREGSPTHPGPLPTHSFYPRLLLNLWPEAGGLGHFTPATQILLPGSPSLLVSATNR